MISPDSRVNSSTSVEVKSVKIELGQNLPPKKKKKIKEQSITGHNEEGSQTQGRAGERGGVAPAPLHAARLLAPHPARRPQGWRRQRRFSNLQSPKSSYAPPFSIPTSLGP